MHWFWRAMAGIVAGCVYAGLAVTVFGGVHNGLSGTIASVLRSWGIRHGFQDGAGVALGYFLPAFLLSYGVYGLLTLRFRPTILRDDETRCRKCGYILRGISEPRCPECGERI